MAYNLRTKKYTMIYFITYLGLVLAVALFSLTKRIGFVESAFISIFLTPLVGFLIVFKAKNNILTYHYKMSHTCPSCDNQGLQKENMCSNCGQVMDVSFNKSKLSLT